MDPLATLAELNQAAQRVVDPTAGMLALASASGLVRDYVGWSISEETVTFVVDGSTTTLLGLPTLRLTAVSEVRVKDGSVGGLVLTESDTGWTGGDTYTWSQRGHLYRACGWPCGFRTVEADVTHGYAVIPDAVRAVVLGLAGADVFSPAGSVLQSKTVGGVSHTYRESPGELTSLQTFQLSGYRLT